MQPKSSLYMVRLSISQGQVTDVTWISASILVCGVYLEQPPARCGIPSLSATKRNDHWVKQTHAAQKLHGFFRWECTRLEPLNSIACMTLYRSRTRTQWLAAFPILLPWGHTQVQLKWETVCSFRSHVGAWNLMLFDRQASYVSGVRSWSLKIFGRLRVTQQMIP